MKRQALDTKQSITNVQKNQVLSHRLDNNFSKKAS